MFCCLHVLSCVLIVRCVLCAESCTHIYIHDIYRSEWCVCVPYIYHSEWCVCVCHVYIAVSGVCVFHIYIAAGGVCASYISHALP